MTETIGEITWAPKEWAIAVDALLSGELIMLLRKGGIREQQSFFSVPSHQVLLFPTHEHQQAGLLRHPYSGQVEQRPVPQIGEVFEVPGWAQITHKLPLSSTAEALATCLAPFHIWSSDWVTQRLSWQPERPAYLLLLRAYRFPSPVAMPYQPSYGGCRSWIQLASAVETSDMPVISAEVYEARIQSIQQALGRVII